MDNIDLTEIRRLYRDGVNIIGHLRERLGTDFNTEQLVEISYDMQTGSYIKFVEENPKMEACYHNEMAQVLRSYLTEGDIVADVGTGEMTTLTAIAAACYEKAFLGYAIDISFSRLLVGMKYLKRKLPQTLSAKIRPVASTLFRLPFADQSIDVVWTTHALEPNGGREREAIAELARVTRKWLVLFEPSYENNSPEGKQRMDRAGYVKNIPCIVKDIPGLKLEQIVPIVNTESELNPTYAHIISKTEATAPRADGLRCPLTQGSLAARDGYLYSGNALLAYPVIEGIPILRVEKGICASILNEEI